MAFLSMEFVLGCPRLVTCLPWLCRDLPCRGGDGTRYDGDPKWQLGVLNGAKPTRDLAGCGTLCRSAGQHRPIAAANCARHSLAVRCQEMNIVDHSLALCMCRKGTRWLS